jgi:serine/threonine protein kinase
MTLSAPLMILLGLLGLVVAILAIIFILVPLMKGIGWTIANLFKAVGWLIMHVIEFIVGVIGDAIRFVGSIPVFLILGVLSMLNVVIGRWSAAGHFSSAAMREVKIAGACLYRIAIRRPLKLVYLHGLLEGMEERVPQAMEAAPGRDAPNGRTGQFEGYTIVGSLRGGGSGGKLYIAEPSPPKKAAIPTIPDRVVIKSFALSDGSSLPQIVRESRALECAKSLGHVIEHGMTPNRFHYVMPYIPGDHLAIVAPDLHAKSDGQGLAPRQLADVLGYVTDLVATLSAYHKGGFWHKDVKPENVIVHNGRAHLVDLGLVTALRSAMTLTTHGTEYFRDPEMVRQALRGVKVHQVDGAKFDVYAAGAVLYFLVENTFPAHGGLSAFHKKSPEALRWIVRRAMAEYQQRYAAADVMLADLHAVASASDPFKVKPVDLPSMRGAAIPDVPVTAPDYTKVSSAGSPLPREGRADESFSGYGVAAGIGAAGPFAQVGRFSVDADGNPMPGAKPATAAPRGKRPLLRVTNWWTGAYVVDDAGAEAKPATLGDAVRQAKSRVPGAPAVVGSRTAAAQLEHARRRVEAARARAQARRGATPLRAPGERQPSPALMAVAFILVFGGIALAMFVVGSLRDRYSGDGRAISVAPSPSGVGAPTIADGGLRSVFVINDVPGPDTFEINDVIRRRIREAVGGAAAIVQDADAAGDFRDLLVRADDSDADALAELARELAARACDAIVWFAPDEDGEPNRFVTRLRTIESAAREVSLNLPTPRAAGGRMVIVNNHPAMGNPEIIRKVAAVHAFYASRDFAVIDDVDADAAIRLAIANVEAGSSGRDGSAVRALMAEHDLDAVLVIDAAGLEGAPTDRFNVSLIEREVGDSDETSAADAASDQRRET